MIVESVKRLILGLMDVVITLLVVKFLLENDARCSLFHKRM